jgi:hypothetical protein
MSGEIELATARILASVIGVDSAGLWGKQSVASLIVNNLPLVDIQEITTTNYIIALSDEGSVRMLTNAAAISVVLPNNMPKGFGITFIQSGSGQITFTNANGAVIRQNDNLTKTKNIWSQVGCLVLANGNNTSAVWSVAGAMV